MHIAVTGSHGLIGGALLPALRRVGHTVVEVVRSEPGEGQVGWDPATGRLDPADLAGVDGVVHLAGVGILRRWSADNREAIRSSRVEGTSLLARTLGAMDTPPKVLVSASAVGWYGDRGDEVLTETSTTGTGFLSQVCREWEASTSPAVQAGIRTVLIRTGIVLSADGGALAAMKPIFALGLGGRLGSGSQWTSWITIDDEVGGIIHALSADGLSGPVNLTAPNPVTNAAYTKALGRAMHRPTVLFVPGAAMRLILGRDMADQMLLGGQRVLPGQLEASGYTFIHRTIDDALPAVLGG